MADNHEGDSFDVDSAGNDSMREQNGSRHRSRSPARKSRSRSRSPREWRRGERNRSRDRDRDRRRSGVREGPGGKVRLYVCNMPYDVRWQDLKDFFKKELGQCVTFVELYENPDGRASGAGVVEIRGKENAEKAIEKLDRAELKGRKIIVREEREKDRRRHANSMGGGMDRDMGGDMGMRGGGGQMNMSSGMGSGGTMGMAGGMNMGGGGSIGMVAAAGGSVSNLNPQLLQQLNVDPNNVTCQVFVANLDYKISARKIKEIFKMAGTVVDVEMKEDKDGKSRGMCIVRFEHPIEAVQAISMFNGQVLYERTMSVKMDRMADSGYAPQQIPNKLPSGLQGIGMGLGSGGIPLSANQLGGSANNLSMGSVGTGSGMMGNMNNMSQMGSNMGSMGNMMGLNSSMGMGSMGNMGTSMASSMNTMPMNSSNMGMGHLGGMGGQMGMSDMNLGGLSTGNMGLNNAGMGNMGGLGDMGMSNLNNMGGGSMGGGSMGGGSMGGGAQNMGGMGGGSGMDRGGYGGSSRRLGDSGGRGGVDMESTSVFVRNLPFSFSWQDLKEKFNNCGDVKFAEIKMENGRSKGYGTVKFMSPEDARRAVNLMNGARIDGRQIEVRLNRV